MKKILFLIVLLIPFKIFAYENIYYESYEAVVTNENGTTVIDVNNNNVPMEKGTAVIVTGEIFINNEAYKIVKIDGDTYYAPANDIGIIEEPKEEHIGPKEDKPNSKEKYEIMYTEQELSVLEIIVFTITGGLSMSLIIIIIKNLQNKKTDSEEKKK